MEGYKIQCVSKGETESNVEYHVTWTSQGNQYRSYVKSFSNALQETSFGELQTISLDHYRLDEFEKMFILNFQKLEESELKTDSNFNIAYQYLIQNSEKVKEASLIDVAQKPLSLGFVYNIFMRNSNGKVIRAEVYLEAFSNKVTIKKINYEDFKTGLIALNQQDNSIKKVVEVVEKQATNPSLKEGQYAVQSVYGKDFLFGKLFVVTISKEGSTYSAYAYHDQSSEEVLMLNWGQSGKPSGCSVWNGEKCSNCVEGYTLINDICTFGCGVLCKTVDF